MRYLVRAKVKPNRARALLDAIERRVLGWGSVAEGEYLRNMAAARVGTDGTVKWVEVCFCATPLDEERAVLGAVLRAHEGAGRPWAGVPRSRRLQALGVRALRLHGAARAQVSG